MRNIYCWRGEAMLGAGYRMLDNQAVDPLTADYRYVQYERQMAVIHKEEYPAFPIVHLERVHAANHQNFQCFTGK